MSKQKIFGIEDQQYLGGYIVGGDNDTYCPEIWNWIISNGIKSILDVGCGEGYSTKYFLDHGIDAIGIEGGKNAIENSKIQNNIILHDYTKGPYIPCKKYDAVWCCEFVEHVDEKYIDNFLTTFSYANHIFMTHALPGQGGYHHVNEQEAKYWIRNIEKNNFIFDQDISLKLRNLSKAKWIKTLLYFKQNTL
jgi:hypothetical protein